MAEGDLQRHSLSCNCLRRVNYHLQEALTLLTIDLPLVGLADWACDRLHGKMHRIHTMLLMGGGEHA